MKTGYVIELHYIGYHAFASDELETKVYIDKNKAKDRLKICQKSFELCKILSEHERFQSFDYRDYIFESKNKDRFKKKFISGLEKYISNHLFVNNEIEFSKPKMTGKISSKENQKNHGAAIFEWQLKNQKWFIKDKWIKNNKEIIDYWSSGGEIDWGIVAENLLLNNKTDREGYLFSFKDFCYGIVNFEIID